MAYIAVDKDGKELICDREPRNANSICWYSSGNFMYLPKGSIEKLIGRKLTWEDEPVELKETKIVCRCGENTREDAGCLECGERATLREAEDE